MRKLRSQSESHLYFDPGDGRLITVFTNEEREPDPARTPTDPGCVHHLAFALSLLEAHKIRVERGDYNIDQIHLADAIETLVKRPRESLSDDRSPRNPYRE